MTYSTPLAGYLVITLIIMFGGKRRRELAEASVTAAGVYVVALFTTSILWMMCLIVYRFMTQN